MFIKAYGFSMEGYKLDISLLVYGEELGGGGEILLYITVFLTVACLPLMFVSRYSNEGAYYFVWLGRIKSV